MKLHILVPTVLFLAVNGFIVSDQWGLVHFTKDEDQLKECLRNEFLAKRKNYKICSNKIMREYAVEYLASRFYLKSRTAKYINIESMFLANDLKNLGIKFKRYDFLEGLILLEFFIQNMIQHCSEVNLYSRLGSDFQQIPRFMNRRNNFEDLMNFILVSFQSSLELLLRERDKRKLLRKYAQEALNVLEPYYNQFYSDFESYLRGEWSERVEIFWDGRDPLKPYINYTYSTKSPERFYTREKFDEFYFRKYDRLSDRDPAASETDIQTVLSVLWICHRRDSFIHYRDRGMTSSDYHLQTHLIQFYRLLFVYLEMEERGIDEESDGWDGPIPYEVLPGSVQNIVSNYDAYRNYLFREKFEYDNSARCGFKPLDQPISEASMILDRWNRLRKARRNGIVEPSKKTKKGKSFKFFKGCFPGVKQNSFLNSEN